MTYSGDNTGPKKDKFVGNYKSQMQSFLMRDKKYKK